VQRDDRIPSGLRIEIRNAIDRAGRREEEIAVAARKNALAVEEIVDLQVSSRFSIETVAPATGWRSGVTTMPLRITKRNACITPPETSGGLNGMEVERAAQLCLSYAGPNRVRFQGSDLRP
jgi:hypothetical protein